MNVRIGHAIRWPIIVVCAAGLIGIGSLATYLVMRSQVPATTRSSDTATAPSTKDPASVSSGASAAEPVPDLSLTLAKEAIDRAGIVASRVSASTAAGRIRVPAVVEPNAYRSVVVTPTVAGRVTSVTAQLGQHVRRGQPLAHVYSPELAERQSRYLSARAELDAHDRELRRTEKLVEIGSASRQELERIHAEHTAAVTMVQSLRSQLTLLGMTSGQIEKLTFQMGISATVVIPAPIDGAITERSANVGMNIDTTTKLFTVIDLSTVWLVGNLYERDLGRVRLGSPARITTSAYPRMMFEGKVSYIDPSIHAETRTAQVRVEVPNRGTLLRLGMYAEILVGEASTERVMVPRAAVQVIGDRSVIYVADPTANGRFIEREVQLGAATDDQVEIVSGVQVGDAIVVKGSFALRAERERLGLHPPSARPREGDRLRAASDLGNTSSARITVSEKGFEPARISLRAGVPVRLTFVRTTDETCATEVAIPALEMKRALPLNQPVDIEFTPEKAGAVGFACGNGTLSGTFVIR